MPVDRGTEDAGLGPTLLKIWQRYRSTTSVIEIRLLGSTLLKIWQRYRSTTSVIEIRLLELPHRKYAKAMGLSSLSQKSDLARGASSMTKAAFAA
jgi:hypothetical protein